MSEMIKTAAQELTPAEWITELAALGQPKYRAGQIYEWIHKKQIVSLEEMTNVPAALRTAAGERHPLIQLRPVEVLTSRLDGTRKFLFALEDDEVIESVLMKYHYGATACISSQVGCRMGCSFCASTVGGLVRNLTAAEMLEQIYTMMRITGEEIRHVVVMGSGEPLENYENLLRFIRILSDEKGYGLSQRNITVSTCGLADRMRSLAEEGLKITLAVSLHAVTDEKRREIMPIARRYSIREIMEAAALYREKTGRQVTFEYSLIAGVNDLAEDSAGLAALAGPLDAHVNLIPVNPVRENDYRRSKASAIEAFRQNLEKQGIHVTIRRELGKDIDGACGQLRRRHLSNSALIAPDASQTGRGGE